MSGSPLRERLKRESWQPRNNVVRIGKSTTRQASGALQNRQEALDGLMKRRERKKLMRECLKRPATVSLLRLEQDRNVQWATDIMQQSEETSSEPMIKKIKKEKNSNDSSVLSLEEIDDDIEPENPSMSTSSIDTANCCAPVPKRGPTSSKEPYFQATSTSSSLISVASLFSCYLSRPTSIDNEDNLVYNLEENLSQVVPVEWKGPEQPFLSREEVSPPAMPVNCARSSSPASSTGFEPQFISSDEEEVELFSPFDVKVQRARKAMRRPPARTTLISDSDDYDDDDVDDDDDDDNNDDTSTPADISTTTDVSTPPPIDDKPKAPVLPFCSPAIIEQSNVSNENDDNPPTVTFYPPPTASSPSSIGAETQQLLALECNDAETHQPSLSERSDAETQSPVLERGDGGKIGVETQQPPTSECNDVEAQSPVLEHCDGGQMNAETHQPSSSERSDIETQLSVLEFCDVDKIQPMPVSVFERLLPESEKDGSAAAIVSSTNVDDSAPPVNTGSSSPELPTQPKAPVRAMARKTIHRPVSQDSCKSSLPLISSEMAAAAVQSLTTATQIVQVQSMKTLEYQLAALCASPRLSITPKPVNQRQPTGKEAEAIEVASEVMEIAPIAMQVTHAVTSAPKVTLSCQKIRLKRRSDSDIYQVSSDNETSAAPITRRKSTTQLKPRKSAKRSAAERRSKSPSLRQDAPICELTPPQSKPFRIPKKISPVVVDAKQQQDQPSIVSPLDSILPKPTPQLGTNVYHPVKPVEKRTTAALVQPPNRMLKPGTAMMTNKNKSPVHTINLNKSPSAVSPPYSGALTAAVASGIMTGNESSQPKPNQITRSLSMSSAPPSTAAASASTSSTVRFNLLPATQDAVTDNVNRGPRDLQVKPNSILKRRSTVSALEVNAPLTAINILAPIAEESQPCSSAQSAALEQEEPMEVGSAMRLDENEQSPPQMNQKHRMDLSIIDEFITDILCWEPKWIEKHKPGKPVPELCHGFGRQMFNANDPPVTYDSVGDYIASMKSRFLRNLFKQLYEEVNLRVTRNVGNFSPCTFASEKEARGSFACVKLRLLLAAEAFECQWQRAPIDMLVELKCSDITGKAATFCYGLISRREKRETTGTMSPSHCLTVEVQLCNRSAIARMADRNHQISVRPVFLLSPFLSQIYGFASIRNSKLSPAFLKPSEGIMATDVQKDVVLHSSEANQLRIHSRQKLCALINDCFEMSTIPRIHLCTTVNNETERNSKVAMLIEELLKRRRQCNNNESESSKHGAILILFSGRKEVGEECYKPLKALRQKLSKEPFNAPFSLLRLRQLEEFVEKRAKDIAKEEYLTSRITALEQQIKTIKCSQAKGVVGIQKKELDEKVLRKRKYEELLTNVRNNTISSQDWALHCAEQRAWLIKSSDVVLASLYDFSTLDQHLGKIPFMAAIVLNGSDIPEFELSAMLQLSVSKVFLFGDVFKTTQPERGRNSTLFERFVANCNEKCSGITLQTALSHFE